METERDNATQGRSDEFRTTSRAAPHHGTAIVGNRLASLQCDSGHHRQAQRGRHEHRAALASKPAAAPGLQGQASLIGRWGSLARAKRWCPHGITRQAQCRRFARSEASGMSKRILVIEDTENNRRILSDLLTNAGFEVLEAVDGEKGVAMAAESRPDLILIYILCPIRRRCEGAGSGMRRLFRQTVQPARRSRQSAPIPGVMLREPSFANSAANTSGR